jgi:hypothetical protein
VRSFHLEKKSEETLKKFLTGCVLNSGKLSTSNREEVTKDQLAKL